MRKIIAELLYPEIFKDYDTQMRYKEQCQESIIVSEEDRKKLLKLNAELNQYLEDLNAEIIEMKTKENSPIDAYMESKYSIIANIAYQQKRKIGTEYYSVYLNQMITPESFEVLKFKQPFIKMLDDKYAFNFNIGNALAKHTTWVDEQKLYDTGDYYLYPEETLTGMRKKCDCEDVSYVMASFDHTNTAVCYGMYNSGDEKFGHAYPCFLHEGQLYIAETTGTSVNIVKFTDYRYNTYFIITKDKTYKVKSGLSFGKITSW